MSDLEDPGDGLTDAARSEGAPHRQPPPTGPLWCPLEDPAPEAEVLERAAGGLGMIDYDQSIDVTPERWVARYRPGHMPVEKPTLPGGPSGSRVFWLRVGPPRLPRTPEDEARDRRRRSTGWSQEARGRVDASLDAILRTEQGTPARTAARKRARAEIAQLARVTGYTSGKWMVRIGWPAAADAFWSRLAPAVAAGDVPGCTGAKISPHVNFYDDSNGEGTITMCYPGYRCCMCCIYTADGIDNLATVAAVRSFVNGITVSGEGARSDRPWQLCGYKLDMYTELGI